MPRKLSNVLTPLAVKNAKPGRHADGGGLHLLVKESGARSWVYRFMLNGKSRDIGLGPAGPGGISLADARTARDALRLKVKAGVDPLEEREREAAASLAAAQAARVAGVTFKQVAEALIDRKEGGWRNAKHRQQWRNTLATYAYPHFGDLPVAQIDTAHVLAVLEPIWTAKPETANRVKQRCKSVMDWCFARQYVTNNPVLLVDHLLPLANLKRAKNHHPALPWAMLPDFFADVLHDGTSGSCRELLEFTILAAARSGEARRLTWDQINFDEKCWYVPLEHMKEANHHRVPLTWRMIEILEARRELALHETLIFPSPRGKIYSENTTTKLLEDKKVKSDAPGRYAVTHGFRSTFRTWGAEQGFREDYLEACLAHVERNAVVASYKRTDVFEARRGIMDAFTNYACSKLNKSNVKLDFI